MEQKMCKVHYDITESKYSKIKTVSEVNKERISTAKSLREEIGGAHYHREQCLSIPDEIDHDKHGLHLEPCYKKFVKILSDKKALSNKPRCSNDSGQDQPRARRSRSLDNGDTRGVYPKECNFCKKYRVKRQQKHHVPILITTLKAAETIKQAAEANDDQSIYFEIKDVDLIAKEFKYHDFCYKEFTRKEKITIATNGKDEDEENYFGDFDAVIQCINERVLCGNQAISMAALHEVYGLRVGDKRYRGKLKKRILSTFGDQLHFLSIDTQTPEIIINTRAINSHTLLNDREHVVEQAAVYLRDDITSFAKATPELSWPLDIHAITSDVRQPPHSIEKFLRTLLERKDHPNSDNVNRLINSYSADLIHGVTRGKFITSKHFLLGLGLHNITGQKKAYSNNKPPRPLY